MKSTLLLVLLLMVSWTSAHSRAHVTVSPGISQFREYRKITVSCKPSPGEWTVWRYTTGPEQVLAECGDGWGNQDSSDCIIETTKLSDSGVYWCQNKHGDSSNTINITVTVGEAVILQSPVHPVMEGDDVTLTCTTKTSILSADFYKDDSFIRTEPTGQMTLRHVSRSDEGLYKCNIRGHGESPPSWLGMKDNSPPASLSVSPDSSQLYEYENVNLTCGGNSNGWRVMRAVNTTTSRGKLSLQTCEMEKGKWGTPTNNGCILETVKKPDSGVYWCESPARQRSNSVRFMVYDKELILRSPLLPVRTGENVTLTCRTPSGRTNHTKFFKDGSLIKTESTGHMTIHDVSKSNEGLYKCGITGKESSSSWLFVLDPPETTSLTRLSVLKVICYVLKIAPYCISTYFMVLLLRQMLTGRKPAVLSEDDEEADQPYDDVTTAHHF